jgi:hypothetical protein
VAGLRALVADLASRAQGATVGGGAVTGDVTLQSVSQRLSQRACESTYKLAASIALHSVSLAVTSEVVGTTALVASSGTRVTTVSTAESTVKSPARSTDTTTGTRGRSGAVALERDPSQPDPKGRREREYGRQRRTARWPGWLQL